MSDFLAKIVTAKKAEVARLKQGKTLKDWEAIAANGPPVNPFWKKLSSQKGMGVIAEIKKASPSVGLIRPDFDPVKIAQAYIAGDATAISVLTDQEFFQGSLQNLSTVRNLNGPPVLRKDFIIDETQVYEARGAGADLVLLIAEILEQSQLESLATLIRSLGMTALVELHEGSNLKRVLDAGATLVGVNNRDLKSFRVDLNTTLEIASRVPSDITLVGESGIQTEEDVQKLWDAGVRLVLVGECLMRAQDPVAQIRKFRNVGA